MPDFGSMSDREVLVWLATMVGTLSDRIDEQSAKLTQHNQRLASLEMKWWSVLGVVASVSAVGGFIGGLVTRFIGG